MEYSDIPSIKIAGSGKTTVQGYGVFKISGSGQISPEMICTSGSSSIPGGLTVGDLKSSGSTRVEGNITAESVKLSGSAHVDGDLVCEELSKSGSLKIGKDLKIKHGKVSGSTIVQGGGTVEKELESTGSLIFSKDVFSEGRIRYSGVMRVDGGLTAESFEARLGRDDSYIRNGVKADYVDVRPGREYWTHAGMLITADIVGDEIILENVECVNVKGNQVTILPGCKVKGVLQYRYVVRVDPSSKLNKEPEKI